jgi:pre-mRNA-processing factor 19
MLFCAISGETPKQPVLSRVSGQIYERALVESYLDENGRDPVTGEESKPEDLIDIKAPREIAPRPPNVTSIPSLLAVFQNEWDSIALETFKLKQQLTKTRQELSTALYEQDAALRVITKLMKERDEARRALEEFKAGE